MSHSINIFKSSTLQTKEINKKNKENKKVTATATSATERAVQFSVFPTIIDTRNERPSELVDVSSLNLKISVVVCFPSILPIKWFKRNCGTQYTIPYTTQFEPKDQRTEMYFL